MTNPIKDPRAIAIDPTSRGFAYAVLEGPAQLIDWSVSEGARASNVWVMGHVAELITHYQPDLLILESSAKQGSRRRPRVQKLLEELRSLAAQHGIAVAAVAQRQVKQMFAAAEAKNKEQIADAILEIFPELTASRPPVRKTWMSEDPRMAIFDAVAFALTHFYFADDKNP